jgi:hypothetical protein
MKPERLRVKTVRSRAATKQAEPPPAPPPTVPSVEEQMQGVSSESILAELIASRCLRSAFHKACAAKAAKALARDHPRDASAWLELLPPPMRVDASGRTVSGEAARSRLLELVMNAQAADAVEEQREVERLQRENAELRARLGAVAVDRAAGVADVGTASRPSPTPATPELVVAPVPRLITPTEADIIPPSELGVPRPAYPDDAKAQARRNAPVIDNPPQPVAGDPTRADEWDRSENAARWREYRRTHGDMDDYLL